MDSRAGLSDTERQLEPILPLNSHSQNSYILGADLDFCYPLVSWPLNLLVSQSLSLDYL